MSKQVKFGINVESNGQKVFSELSVELKDLEGLIKEVTRQTNKAKGGFEKMAHKATVFTAANTALSNLRDVIGGLADDYKDFDKGMRAVNTMAGLNAAGMKELTGKVEDLAGVIPLARKELADGLYQVISSGVPKDNWISFLEASGRSAVGGIADLSRIVEVTTTVIKNYGLEWDEAKSLQDKIQKTAENGVTTFEQLAAALPKVTGNAATLGVTIDELMATFATLTGVSGNTAEVSTQLSAVFTALVKPSVQAAKMAEQMGVQFDAAAIKASGGMQNFLNNLTATVKEYAATHGMLEQEIYGRLFGSAEALRALIPITGELRDTFSANVDAMANSTGSIDRAFEEMAGSSDAVSQKLKNMASSMLSGAGAVASALQPFLELVAVSGLAITSFGTLSKSTGALFSSVKALVPAKIKLLRVMVKLKPVMLSLPYVAIAAAVVALSVAVYKLVTAETAAEKAQKKVNEAVSNFRVAIDSELAGINSLFSMLRSAKEGTEAYGAAKQAILDKYGDYLKGLNEEIRTLKDVEGAYIAISTAAKQAAKERAIADLNTQAQKDYGENRKNAINGLRDYLSRWVDDSDAVEALIDTMVREFDKTGKVSEETRVLPYRMRGEDGDLSRFLKKGSINTYYTNKINDFERAMADAATAYDYTLKESERAFGSSMNEFSNMTAVQAKAALNAAKQLQGKVDKGEKWRIQGGEIGIKDITGTSAADLQLVILKLEEIVELRKKIGDTNPVVMSTEDKASIDAELKKLNDELVKLSPKDAMGAKGQALKARIQELELIIQKAYTINNQVKEIKDNLKELKPFQEGLDLSQITSDDGHVVSEPAPPQEPQVNLNAATLAEIEGNIDILEDKLKGATIANAAIINGEKKMWEDRADAIRRAGLDAAESVEMTGKSLRDAWGDLKGIGSGIDSITESLRGNGSAWETLTGIVDGFMGIYDGVMSILGIMDMLNRASESYTVTKAAEMGVDAATAAVKEGAAGAQAVASEATVAANKMETASFKELAAAKYMAAHAAIPFAGYGIAAGFTAAMLATVEAAGATAFADGGIVYGPTLGLVGEYSGAGRNPEVIAPLDKLKSMIDAGDNGVAGKVTFKIKGRELVGVLEKEYNVMGRR